MYTHTHTQYTHIHTQYIHTIHTYTHTHNTHTMHTYTQYTHNTGNMLQLCCCRYSLKYYFIMPSFEMMPPHSPKAPCITTTHLPVDKKLILSKRFQLCCSGCLCKKHSWRDKHQEVIEQVHTKIPPSTHLTSKESNNIGGWTGWVGVHWMNRCALDG